MRRATLLAFAIVACSHPKTPAERCRAQAAWARSARAINGQQSPAADALEQMRCDQLERDQHAVEREQRAAEREASRESAAVTAERERQHALVRAAPSAPEVDATVAEARVTCERQQGRFVADASMVGCFIGQPMIFSGALDDAGRITRVDVFYEGADLTTVRRRIETELGPPHRETVSPDGFRVFSWAEDRIAVTMYAKGVRLTRAK